MFLEVPTVIPGINFRDQLHYETRLLQLVNSDIRLGRIIYLKGCITKAVYLKLKTKI